MQTNVFLTITQLFKPALAEYRFEYYSATIYELYSNVMKFWSRDLQKIPSSESIVLRASILLQHALLGPNFAPEAYFDISRGRQHRDIVNENPQSLS
jgi:hypothetical protein